MTAQIHTTIATRLAALALAGLLAACAGRAPEPAVILPVAPPEPPAVVLDETPRIVETSVRFECVTYARQISAFALYGNAWTWWDQAAGLYDRGSTPRAGAALVLKRKGDSQGHIAVVLRVIDSRTILTEHANWLNRGEIQKNSRILDVSPANDWSQVRVWYTPGNSWGISTYPAYGFIYPQRIASL